MVKIKVLGISPHADVRMGVFPPGAGPSSTTSVPPKPRLVLGGGSAAARPAEVGG
ncbi:hypothetical protein EMIHUDRAFT_256195 [Emiliania huxleyi CCMP1516]|uniref:Uncharacterized protein n=2 Tax=Emiliania huxleyi TaxID=2903 RepID=A0A0D3IYU1_EMIH1|nr:hypothetical protein EMIHUDRAFT_256195 [Emiliania huxleyi CCMP1516]EOD16426.1 hypothetical protein EMIHUDRAFT_256195 [Emiliania huxleyi CCMP1516]|eukprot:XP_005768855.1 hypothetical protein EMIHUDRAFT_256195 [Emiliania huxleyi CCMP1516]